MILSLLFEATLQTLYMTLVACLIATAIGLPLGIFLFVSRKGSICQQAYLHQFLSALINITRSIPFIVLMIAILPLTRLLVGTSIGTNAAIVPLSLGTAPFVARIVDNALREINNGLVEAALSMGATAWQIIIKILIPEALPSIVNGMTLILINLISFSAMAGAVGGGGLGDLAIRYGYQRFDMTVMLLTIIIMVVMVQFIQFCGDVIVKKISHFR